VQPVFRGSYCQFGTGGLERDVEDLSELLTHLAEQRGAHTFALLGHSTGCQIIVQFLRSAASAPLRARVRVAVLQAPVSDREAAPASGVALEELLPRARASVGRGEPGAIVHVLYGIAPLSAVLFIDVCILGTRGVTLITLLRTARMTPPTRVQCIQVPMTFSARISVRRSCENGWGILSTPTHLSCSCSPWPISTCRSSRPANLGGAQRALAKTGCAVALNHAFVGGW
jgi:pimeloyl-ACP methyl ester carboxylesterase